MDEGARGRSGQLAQRATAPVRVVWAGNPSAIRGYANRDNGWGLR